MRNLIKKIQNFAFQAQLWPNGSKIVVGVSGGPDSTCLLDVLTKLAPKYNFELHVAHVNYGLRGQDSEGDEVFVKKLAEQHGLKVSLLKSQKTNYKGNLENELREIRYAFFEKVRKNLNYDLIAVAHNQDDQAETILMRLMRGSSLNGLAAMKAQNVKIIRPLLQTSKFEILAYLKQNKLKFRIDKSNKELKFTRNKIRRGLLPYLEKNFNPAIKETIANLANFLSEDYAFIEQHAQKFLLGAYKKERLTFDTKDFFELHVAVQRQVLRSFLREQKKELNGIESGQIEELRKVIKSAKNKTQKARIGGLNIIKKGDKIEIF